MFPPSGPTNCSWLGFLVLDFQPVMADESVDLIGGTWVHLLQIFLLLRVEEGRVVEYLEVRVEGVDGLRDQITHQLSDVSCLKPAVDRRAGHANDVVAFMGA